MMCFELISLYANCVIVTIFVCLRWESESFNVQLGIAKKITAVAILCRTYARNNCILRSRRSVHIKKAAHFATFISRSLTVVPMMCHCWGCLIDCVALMMDTVEEFG